MVKGGSVRSRSAVMIASESGIITRVCHHVQGLRNGPMPIIAIRSASSSNQNSAKIGPVEIGKEGKRRLVDIALTTSIDIKLVITVFTFLKVRGCGEASPMKGEVRVVIAARRRK